MNTYLNWISEWPLQCIILFLSPTPFGRYFQLLFLDPYIKCSLLMTILKFLLFLKHTHKKRNGTFKFACFLLLTIETLTSAVYPKTKISHWFLNLTLFGCLLGLWLLCIFKIFNLPGTVLQVSFFLRKGRFLLPYKDDKCKSAA